MTGDEVVENETKESEDEQDTVQKSKKTKKGKSKPKKTKSKKKSKIGSRRETRSKKNEGIYTIQLFYIYHYTVI